MLGLDSEYREAEARRNEREQREQDSHTLWSVSLRVERLENRLTRIENALQRCILAIEQLSVHPDV
jgi:hypothetical protein